MNHDHDFQNDKYSKNLSVIVLLALKKEKKKSAFEENMNDMIFFTLTEQNNLSNFNFFYTSYTILNSIL